MSVMMIQAEIKPEYVEELEQSAAAMFAALAATGPSGVRYASCRFDDGVTFVALLEVEVGTENPLPGIAEFRDFQAGLEHWTAAPPRVHQITVVGSYRLFG
jgi:hypothetical protein